MCVCVHVYKMDRKLQKGATTQVDIKHKTCTQEEQGGKNQWNNKKQIYLKSTSQFPWAFSPSFTHFRTSSISTPSINPKLNSKAPIFKPSPLTSLCQLGIIHPVLSKVFITPHEQWLKILGDQPVRHQVMAVSMSILNMHCQFGMILPLFTYWLMAKIFYYTTKQPKNANFMGPWTLNLLSWKDISS